MTLGLVVLAKGNLIAAGDVLVSTERKDESQPITYPTVSAKSHNAKRLVVELMQKIVRLRGDIFLIWSGNTEQAARFIDYMRGSVKHVDANDSDAIKEAADAYMRLHREQMVEFQFALLFSNENENRIWATNVTCIQNELFDTLYALESGTGEVANYLKLTTPLKLDSALHSPVNAPELSEVLTFLLDTIERQQTEGYGLDNAWGGAFEIVLRKTGKFLEKLDNVLTLTFEYHWDSQRKFTTAQIGRRFFQFYDGENLIVLSQGKREAIKHFVICPPDKTRSNECWTGDLDGLWVQMVVIRCNEVGSKNRETIICYDERGHNWCGIKSDDHYGQSIRVNTSQLENLVRGRLPDIPR